MATKNTKKTSETEVNEKVNKTNEISDYKHDSCCGNNSLLIIFSILALFVGILIGYLVGVNKVSTDPTDEGTKGNVKVLGNENSSDSGDNNTENEGNSGENGDSNSGDSGEANSGEGKVYDASGLKITLIGDQRCSSCAPTETLSEIFTQIDFLTGAEIVSQDFSDAGVEDYIKSVGINVLPAVIFSNNNIDDSAEEEANRISTYLTQLSDGQYSLDIGSEFDPFAERSDKGFLILDKAKYDEILANLYVDGNKNSKITILEYSDIECPYCAKIYTEGTIKSIKDNYGDDVNIYFNHFPLSFHANALPGAIILECLGEEVGAEAFYKLIETSFESGKSTKDYLIEEAVKLGANKDTITKCSDEAKYEEKVTKIQDLGADTFGISGTPGNVIINNETLEYEILSGAYPFDYFKELIDKMME